MLEMNKRLTKISFIFLCLCCLFSRVDAQADSCKFEISLLTCSPGEELYSAFGHSALRLRNHATGEDLVFNYGTFDFNDPAFYSKFVRGKLLYYLSIERFPDFAAAYEYEKRSIIEQTLSLSCEEKLALTSALFENAQEQNKFYAYDFLFDNCSTRLRDIVAKAGKTPLAFRRIVPQDAPTFRDLIHEYLERGGQFWSKFGIDILLGSRLDRPVENAEAMFLPDYLLKGFDSASFASRPLIQTKSVLVNVRADQEERSWFRPIVVTSALLILVVLIQFSKSRWSANFFKIFDRVFFMVLGVIGILILFMWFGTDHRVCRDNANLLWALPIHVPMSLFTFRRKNFVSIYFKSAAFYYFGLFFAWALIPQDMNSAIVPLVILAAIRSYEQFRKTKARD
jgi:hypothetical protein